MQILQPTPQAAYSGVINAASRITTTEGARTLWRGVNSVIMGAGPAHALYFATYEHAKQAFGGNGSGHHPLAAGKKTCAHMQHSPGERERERECVCDKGERRRGQKKRKDYRHGVRS